MELDETAEIISYEEYHPFGTTSYRSGRTETKTSQKRYKYVGKERDEETGLYYYGARYYAAWICRFVSVDPLQFDYPYYTPFQYAGNKPISYIDLDGLEEARPADVEAGLPALDNARCYRSSIEYNRVQKNAKNSSKYGADILSAFGAMGMTFKKHSNVYLGSDNKLYLFKDDVPTLFKDLNGQNVSIRRSVDPIKEINYKGNDIFKAGKSFTKLTIAIDLLNVGIDFYQMEEGIEGAKENLIIDGAGLVIGFVLPELELIIGFGSLVASTEQFANEMVNTALRNLERIETEWTESGDPDFGAMMQIPEYQKWSNILKKYQPMPKDSKETTIKQAED